MITSYFESDNNAPAHGSITRICSTIVVAYNIASDFAVMQRSLSAYKVFTFYRVQYLLFLFYKIFYLIQYLFLLVPLHISRYEKISCDLCPIKSPIDRMLITFQLIKRAGKGVVVLSQDTPAQILSARKCRISSDSITNSSEIAGR